MYYTSQTGLGITATPRETAGQLYSEGSAAYEAGNFILSERKYREAYATVPNAIVLVAIARSAEAQGQKHEAYLLYERYLSQEPSGTAASMAREGMERTRPPKQISTTAPATSSKPLPAETPSPQLYKPPPASEVYEDSKTPSIAIWVASGVGVLGLLGLGYFLTRPKKLRANRRRR